jgi:hypothetical protein
MSRVFYLFHNHSNIEKVVINEGLPGSSFEYFAKETLLNISGENGTKEEILLWRKLRCI